MITPAQSQEIQSRLARNRRRAVPQPLEPLANERLATHVEIGAEIETLHKPFQQWCNLHGVLWPGYSRPDKATRAQKGVADFVLLKNGRGCCIEFKALAKPETGLSREQADFSVACEESDVPWLCTNSLAAAIEFAKEKLNL